MAENDITMNEMFAFMEEFMKDMDSRMQRLEEIHQKPSRTEGEDIQNDLNRGKEENILYLSKATVEVDELKEKVCALPIMDFKQPYNNEMRSVIGLNMVANPDRHPNLKCTLTHWVLLCQRSLFACARDVISNLWIQLLRQIHFRSIGTHCHFHERPGHNIDDCS
uniref:Uncharacterized protein n=1 Tax=Fagus sylvatica TaxID=28930 RepID=A0A2N9HP66_FAGSY